MLKRTLTPTRGRSIKCSLRTLVCMLCASEITRKCVIGLSPSSALAYAVSHKRSIDYREEHSEKNSLFFCEEIHSGPDSSEFKETVDPGISILSSFTHFIYPLHLLTHVVSNLYDFLSSAVILRSFTSFWPHNGFQDCVIHCKYVRDFHLNILYSKEARISALARHKGE